MKKSGLIIIVVVLILLPFISGNLFDAIKTGFEDITGRGTSNATTVTISVGANAPNISFVSLNESITIVEGGIRSIDVSFWADDPDGNLENASASINISSGSTAVTNASCTNEHIGSGVIAYNCTVDVLYSYAPGNWEVSAEINDTSNSKTQNQTTWDLQQLTGMNVSTASLTWPVVIPSGVNSTSDNDPIAMENTGNAATLNIFVQGIDLWEDVGLDNTTGMPAANFTVFNATTAANAECDDTNRTGAISYGQQPVVLVNDTDMPVVLNALPRGAGNIDNLYFCLFDAPSGIVSGTYSTGGAPDEEDWTISVS